MTTNDNDKLVKLSDTNETVVTGDKDIRGRSVKDKNGEDIGKVEDLLVDLRENKVRFLVVGSGGFLGLGETKSFIPVDAVSQIADGEVHIDQTRERAAGAPRYDPELVNDRQYHQDATPGCL
jgi:sporulation protein YlmC with PRC-barrel domain